VFEDDETGRETGNISHNELPILEDLCHGVETARNVEISGIKCRRGTDAGPDDRNEIHGGRESADTVIDITVRRSPVKGSDTEDIMDELLGPTKLGDNFLVSQSGHIRMTPGVDTDLMTRHVLLTEDVREGDSAGTDGEECCADVDLGEVLQEVLGIGSRAIIVSDTPSHFVRASCDISATSAASASPPATSGICNSLRVGGATTENSGRDVGDRDTGVVDLLDPLLYLWRICGRRLIERRIVGGVQSGDIWKRGSVGIVGRDGTSGVDRGRWEGD